jgi:uncharacterized protein
MTQKKAVIVFFIFVILGFSVGCGSKHKTKEEYYPDGKLKAVYTYNDAGLLDGEVKKYFPNGKFLSEEIYKNNELDGISRVYYESGKAESEGQYKDGKLDGIYKSYYENGNLKSSGEYKAGILVGSLDNYDENGKIKRSGNDTANSREDNDIDTQKSIIKKKPEGKNTYKEPPIRRWD